MAKRTTFTAPTGADALFQAWLPGDVWLGIGTEAELVGLRAEGLLPAGAAIIKMTDADLAAALAA